VKNHSFLSLLPHNRKIFEETEAKTTTMKSPSPSPTPSQAQNTGTCPLTLIDAILHSIMSNDASADSCQALSPPLPTLGDTPETRAVKRKRFLMILDLAMALIEEDGEADFTRAIDE
jgi:hypothetical protein